MTTAAVILESTLTCPQCGHATLENMPLDSCRFFHECPIAALCCGLNRETVVFSAPTVQ